MMLQKKPCILFSANKVLRLPSGASTIDHSREIYDLSVYGWRNCAADRSLSLLACSGTLECMCACIAPLLVLHHTALTIQFHIRTRHPSLVHLRRPSHGKHLFPNANLNLDLFTRERRMVRKLAITNER